MAKNKAPENETDQEKFARVAGQRVGLVIDRIKLLASMGDSCPNDEYAHKAFAAIETELAVARTAWKQRSKQTVFAF